MTEIRFYHMQTKTLEDTLPEIVEKALGRDYRAIIKTTTADQATTLDELLWTYDSKQGGGSFIPHGAAPSDNAGDCPVWLTAENDNPNNANLLILTHGATAEDVSGFALCCEMLDGRNDDAIAAGRERWKRYKDAGHDVSYFQQTPEGRWEKKA
ncbi:MAG: DNA polymerase III subunit chi [Alphaproteobacteria bacterium]|nr:DNA polymerase III subunit chi [Alphaproteobacteria bacterium]